jgi:electron transfer flavoprotein alpha/beta subunit
MNIIVCIKQVPDTTNVRINPDTNTLVRDGVESIINPFDTYAIEEGLRIRERLEGEHKVICLSMGPPQAENALREAISLGVDEAVLLSDRAFAGSDTWATSVTLAAGVRKIGDYGIILSGKQAIDGDTAQVGPGIAVHLNIPQITFVRKIEEITERKIRAERLMEDGYQVIESRMPVMVSVVKEINEPRMPSLKGKMKARKAAITVWTAEDIELDPKETGLDASPTMVNRIFTPERRGGGRVLEGETPDMVDELVGELEKANLI